jgi:hypothetical protein
VKLEGAGIDFTRAVKFNAGLNLREGGQLSAQGMWCPPAARSRPIYA